MELCGDAFLFRSSAAYKIWHGLGRKAVGYEIAEEYCKLIVNRNKQHVLI